MKGCLKRIIQASGVIVALAVVLVVVALTTDIGKAPAAVVAITPLPTVAQALTSLSAPWYAGGTLHSATVAEWRTADQRNKLATAADWAAQGFDTVEGLKEKATSILACVEEAFDAYAATHGEADTVTDLAVGCVILLKAQ